MDIVRAIHASTQTPYARVQCAHCRTATFKTPLYEGLQAAYRRPDAVAYGVTRQCLACRMTKSPPAITHGEFGGAGEPATSSPDGGNPAGRRPKEETELAQG